MAIESTKSTPTAPLQQSTALTEVQKAKTEKSNEFLVINIKEFLSAPFKGMTSGAPVQSTKDTAEGIANAERHMSIDIYAVMALVQRTAQEMRNTNREIRASALDSQVGELLKAADDTQKAANFKFAAAMVQSAFQIGGGFVQLGTSIASGREAASAAKAQNQSNHFKDMSKSFDKGSEFRGYAKDESKHFAGIAKGFNQAADKINAKGKMVGEFSAGVGSAISAGLNFAASKAEVEAKRHEATAKLHESAVSGANEMMQQMMDVIRDIKDKLGAMDQSRIETNRAINRNI